MNKNTLIKGLIIIGLIIIIPIIFNIVKMKIAGNFQMKAMMMPVEVETTTIKEQEINKEMSSSGRIEAPISINVIARISGWLQKKYFTEGDYVKEGDILFQIEPDEYELAVKNAQAATNKAEAQYINSEKELTRAEKLVKGDYVSKSYYDNALASRDSNLASYQAAKAELNKRKLDLSYTKVLAPIDGKIGKNFITVGNYVNAATGTLANIVSVDPIYATFTIKSDELLKYKKADSNSEIPDVTVNLQLSDGTMYKHEGKLDFIDNKVDTTLGTIALRATFPNPERTLIPNDFITIIMKSNAIEKVTLIPQDICLENVNSKYVFVIEDGKAKQRNIKVSGVWNKYWILEEGLTDKDVIISSNIQKIRDGAKVKVVDKTENAEENKNSENNK